MKLKLLFILVATALLAGCVGRTGKVGTPIAERYQTEINCLQIGKSTPDDLKRCFGKKPVALKEEKVEDGKTVQIWEVARGGNMDAGALILWGYVAYDKDQSILFRFENGILVSFESIVLPDPPSSPPAAPTKSPHQS